MLLGGGRAVGNFFGCFAAMWVVGVPGTDPEAFGVLWVGEEGVERRRALLAPLSSASSSTQKRSDTASSDTTSRI